MQKTGIGWMKYSVTGGIGAMVITLLLSLLGAVLVQQGLLPQSWIAGIGAAAGGIGCLLGALFAVRKHGTMGLPTALLTAVVFLAIGCLIHLLCFRDDAQWSWFTVLAAAVAAVLAAILGTRRKKRRK